MVSLLANLFIVHSKKFQVQLRNEKYPVNIYNYGIKRKLRKKKWRRDHGELQTQIPERLDDEYKYTSGRNDRWPMRLKLIQEDYYSIENQKS